MFIPPKLVVQPFTTFTRSPQRPELDQKEKVSSSWSGRIPKTNRCLFTQISIWALSKDLLFVNENLYLIIIITLRALSIVPNILLTVLAHKSMFDWDIKIVPHISSQLFNNTACIIIDSGILSFSTFLRHLLRHTFAAKYSFFSFSPTAPANCSFLARYIANCPCYPVCQRNLPITWCWAFANLEATRRTLFFAVPCQCEVLVEVHATRSLHLHLWINFFTALLLLLLPLLLCHSSFCLSNWNHPTSQPTNQPALASITVINAINISRSTFFFTSQPFPSGRLIIGRLPLLPLPVYALPVIWKARYRRLLEKTHQCAFRHHRLPSPSPSSVSFNARVNQRVSQSVSFPFSFCSYQCGTKCVFSTLSLSLSSKCPLLPPSPLSPVDCFSF